MTYIYNIYSIYNIKTYACFYLLFLISKSTISTIPNTPIISNPISNTIPIYLTLQTIFPSVGGHGGQCVHGHELGRQRLFLT
jgi:hypothetical protein